ncbi:MAG: flavin reductase family protein [Candidatus Atribacteria bacterium]|nr:flavin reductase family protein [Candidatus Atribacteria bacterium]
MRNDIKSWREASQMTMMSLEKMQGVFLVTQGGDKKPNIMTIGWLQSGIIWGRPILTVLVRPSRYTFHLLEENPAFSVCVPTDAMVKAIEICGTLSGAQHNKFQKTGLTPIYPDNFPVPFITECPACFACVVVQKTRVEPATFSTSILKEYYSSGDFHNVYWGEIHNIQISE